MSLPVLTANNVKIYNVTGLSHHRLPDWIVKKNARKLKKDAEWSRRVQLIQDFEFPEASLRLAFTPDQRHIIACGVYKPQFRVYDLSEMSMRFERHTSAETVSMQILSEDWRKLALLQSDRFVEFHGPSGLYHSTRIPKMGRDMLFDSTSCDMLIAASSSELYRLNLDRGQYLAPFETLASAVNCVRIAPLHGLCGLACDNGQVEFWDKRDRNRLGAIQLSRSASSSSTSSMMKTMADDDERSLEVTSLAFLPDGIHWAGGTSDGRVLLFDLRNNQRALAIHDHYNGFPIKKLEYNSASGCLVSADERVIKFWHTDSRHTASSSDFNGNKSSALFTAIECDNAINDFVLQEGSGLVLVANEAPTISTFFIPSLGPAPAWCSFLENITEEMEEKGEDKGAAVYENFKFVTRQELAQLGLDHLVGTKLLRAYMHGYFIDLRLYEKAKAIANPFAYEEYLARMRSERLEKERQSRIRAKDPLKAAKVNKKLAERLVANEQSTTIVNTEAIQGPVSKEEKHKKRAKETAQAILQDDRFTDLFKNPDFEIDEDSNEFKMQHPSAKTSKTRK